MARYKEALCRLCRRQGEKLFLKGTRCNTDKCAVSKRQTVPGMHGSGRQKKLSNYGLQLREKQKAKRIYGVLEKQFRLYYHKAASVKGVTGEVLLQFLERRLDNVIFKLRFAKSRNEARQIVRHGHVKLNGRKVNIPSYLVRPGDKVEITGDDKFKKAVNDNLELTEERTVPSWLNLDKKGLSGEISAMPTREEVGFPIREQLIVELYSK